MSHHIGYGVKLVLYFDFVFWYKCSVPLVQNVTTLPSICYFGKKNPTRGLVRLADRRRRGGSWCSDGQLACPDARRYQAAPGQCAHRQHSPGDLRPPFARVCRARPHWNVPSCHRGSAPVLVPGLLAQAQELQAHLVCAVARARRRRWQPGPVAEGARGR